MISSAMSGLMDRLSIALAPRYEFERPIGEGGMATVYLARDVRYGRRVAIKVLKPELAARLGSERFLQEIRVTANLQHPNILPLYESGATDEFLYYVTPYVEGESLRTKIDRERQLDVEQTIHIVRSVAAALEYAHRHGVVHRDIKPENILLQHGEPLVADFGIALAVSAAGGERLTETGMSVGTPHYMSPEQATGERSLDARSDVYSLGAVTYEMLTGDPPHHASNAQAVIARMLTQKPVPITQIRELVPPNVDAAVLRALSRNPADRFAHAAQFSEALANPAYRLPDSGAMRAMGAPGGALPAPWLWTGAAATLVAGLLAGWLLRGPAEREGPRGARPSVFFLPFDSGAAVPGYPALSPDGSVLVYPAGDAGSNRLFLRRLDNPIPTPLPQTEGAQFAFFSPDGEWVGFLSDQSLKKVRVRDGSDAVIAPFVEGMAGATWRADDTILLSMLPKGALYTVPAAGGTPAPLVVGRQKLDSGFYFPHFLPGGRAVAFNTESTGGELGVLDLETGERRLLGRGLRPSFVGMGHLVFANPEGRLAIQRFDLRRLDTVGAPSVLPENLGVGRGRAFYTVSRGGTLAIIRAAGTDLEVELLDDAKNRQLLLTNGWFWAPRFSPDGNLIAFGGRNPDDLWVYDLRTHGRVRLTLDGASANDPAWSPDGRQIAFASDLPSRKDISVRALEGNEPARRLLAREGLQWPSAWTRDGYVVFTDVPLDEDRDIWVVKADGSEAPFAYLDTPFIEKSGDVSSDGRWIAYDSNSPGRFEVFVDRFPTRTGSPLRVSSSGGRNPRWGRDGRTLYYWRERALVAVRLDLADRPRVVASRTVLEASYASADHANFDVHPDGKRFVVVTGRARPQRIIVALDPFAAVVPRR